MMVKPGAALLLALLLGCGGNQGAGVDAVGADRGVRQQLPLASSLEVEVREDSVRLVLHVTNPSSRPAVLEFSSGQRYDFAVRTEAGADVWRWSADRSFTQALGSETIAPGGTLDYAAVWLPGARTGSFVAIGELTSTSHPVREQAAFRLE